MERPGRHWNCFVGSSSDSAARANRVERLGLFLDDHSCAASFRLSEATNRAEVRSENGVRGTRDMEGKVTRVGARTEQRGRACDVDGQNREVETVREHMSQSMGSERVSIKN
jgi:hypothetical protein